MVDENKFRASSVAKEHLYGWYPSNEDKQSRDPKEVYMFLGARHPKPESYTETETLNQYHKENKKFQYKNLATPEEAANPPWALSVKPIPNKPSTDNFNRSKSAPVSKNWRPQKNHLEVPQPQLYNLFDGEAKHIYFPHSSNSTKPPLPPTTEPNITTDQQQQQPQQQTVIFSNQNYLENQSEEANEENEINYEEIAPIYLEAQNPGKKPILTQEDLNKENLTKQRRKSAKILNRPKTCSVNHLNDEKVSYLKTRSQSSCSLKQNRPPSSTKQQKQQYQQYQQQQQQQYQHNQYQQQYNQNTPTPVRPDSRIKEIKEIKPQIESIAMPENYVKMIRKSSMSSTKSRNIYSPNTNQHQIQSTNVYQENWKSELLEREKYLQKRPNYFVKIDFDKLKPDREAPQIHYNCPETFYYNTMPFRKATFTIDPSFISENLNVSKIDLKFKESMRGTSMEPVKYRRDYAFVY